MPYCVNCGHQVVSDATFCDECGAEAFRPPAGVQQPLTANGTLDVRPVPHSSSKPSRWGSYNGKEILACQAVAAPGYLTSLDELSHALRSGAAIIVDFKPEADGYNAHFPALNAGAYTVAIVGERKTNWDKRITVTVFAGSSVEVTPWFEYRYLYERIPLAK